MDGDGDGLGGRDLPTRWNYPHCFLVVEHHVVTFEAASHVQTAILEHLEAAVVDKFEHHSPNLQALEGNLHHPWQGHHPTAPTVASQEGTP